MDQQEYAESLADQRTPEEKRIDRYKKQIDALKAERDRMRKALLAQEECSKFLKSTSKLKNLSKEIYERADTLCLRAERLRQAALAPAQNVGKEKTNG